MRWDTHTLDACLETPFGGLGVIVRDESVVRISFLNGPCRVNSRRSPVVDKVLDQLRCYLDDPHTEFELPWGGEGTAFQQRVWEALRQIPVGATCSYGDLARQLDTSARAVGGACRANPTVVLVPCHRVVAATGLGGFSGETEGAMPEIKRWLLRHEGARIGNG